MNHESVSQLLLEFMRETDCRIWIGLAVTVTVGMIEIILGRKGLISSRSTKRMQQARAKGHVLTAQLIAKDFEYFTDGDKNHRIRTYIGTYEYEVNGRKKKVVESFHNSFPPQTLRMYYVSNPEKAFSEMHVTESPTHALFLLIAVAAGVAVTMLLGFRG